MHYFYNGSPFKTIFKKREVEGIISLPPLDTWSCYFSILLICVSLFIYT